MHVAFNLNLPKESPLTFNTPSVKVKKTAAAGGGADGPVTFDCKRRAAGAFTPGRKSTVNACSHKKAVVQVFVMVLDSGGADVAPAVVCAALALADAGLPMRDLVSACTLSRREGSLLLDPVEEEIADEDGSLLVACMPNAGKVTQLLSSGDWHVSKYRQALGLAVDGCAKYLPLMNTALADGYQKRKDQLAA